MSRLSELPEKIQNRLRKVLALAKKGVAGEAESARGILDKLLKQYELELSDLEGSPQIEREFYHDGDGSLTLRLLIALTRRIFLKELSADWLDASTPGILIINGSVVDLIDLESHYEIYKARLAEDTETFFIAFIGKNDLWAGEADPDYEPSEEEIKQRQAAYRMQAGLEQTKIRKGITG